MCLLLIFSPTGIQSISVAQSHLAVVFVSLCLLSFARFAHAPHKNPCLILNGKIALPLKTFGLILFHRVTPLLGRTSSTYQKLATSKMKTRTHVVLNQDWFQKIYRKSQTFFLFCVISNNLKTMLIPVKFSNFL